MLDDNTMDASADDPVYHWNPVKQTLTIFTPDNPHRKQIEQEN